MVLEDAKSLYENVVESTYIGTDEHDKIATAYRGRSIVLLAIEIMKGEK